MSTHVAATHSWEKDPNEVRRALVREMNRIGAYRLEGHYSGGHDEGGLEYMTLFDKKGEKVVRPDGENFTWDDKIWQAVEDLLSTKFYTWALECSVYGNVYVDLKQQKAWTEGHEETTDYVEDTDPINMSW